MRIARKPQHLSFSQKTFSQNYAYILNRHIKFVVSNEYEMWIDTCHSIF